MPYFSKVSFMVYNEVLIVLIIEFKYMCLFGDRCYGFHRFIVSMIIYSMELLLYVLKH